MQSLVMNELHAKNIPEAPAALIVGTVIPTMTRPIKDVREKQHGIAYSVYYYMRHLERLIHLKDKALDELKRTQAGHLALLDSSDLRQKNPDYWADLRKREAARLHELERMDRLPIDQLRTALSDSKHAKFHGINGVKPSGESLANRHYALTADIYAVIRADAGPGSPALVLRDWLLSDEGKSAIRSSGYVTSP